MTVRSLDGAAGGVETLHVDGSRVRVVPELDGAGPRLAPPTDALVAAVVARDGLDQSHLWCAVDESGRVLGAAKVTFTGVARAHGAVAVASQWRRRGLGTVLARRLVDAAQAGGARYLTCRCLSGDAGAERTATLFGQECVHTVRVGFELLLVLRLPG